MTIKLRNSNLANCFKSGQASGIACDTLRRAESIAPINVHSHGQLLNNMIEDLEHALAYAKAFRNEVQGR